MKANRAINPRFAKALFVFFAQKRRLLSVRNEKRLFLFEDGDFLYSLVSLSFCAILRASPQAIRVLHKAARLSYKS